jgi:hypothetical protein
MRFVFSLLAVLEGSAASITSTGFTLKLNDISYYAPPRIVTTITIQDVNHSFTPGKFAGVTVITTDNPGFGLAELSAVKKNYTQGDDVWQGEFSEIIYLQYTGTGKFAPNLVNTTTVIFKIRNSTSTIPSGPYFLSSDGSLYEAHRLYSDFIGAFSETVTSNRDGTFSVLPANVWGQSLAVAVPSRLYYTKTAAKPLAGIRIGIKDIFDISGLRTSNGNRAWYHLYPPANATALAVQNLIDAGAIVVGKTKTSQFANGAQATSDWVDYHSPFNPRSDGYQDTSSSSAGSGAAVAAYPWLDLGLGSDTGGSIRGPAHSQGIYGNRPSYGLVSLRHVMPLAPQLDTAGLLARDPLLWSTAAKALYGLKDDSKKKYPTEILTIEYPEYATSEANAKLIDFLDILVNFLLADRIVFSISESWARAKPRAPPLQALLNKTYSTIISKEQIKNVRRPFFRDYAAAYDGRWPFVDPTSQTRWASGARSSSTIEEAVANKTIFMHWIQSEILVSHKDTCSDKILVSVRKKMTPWYRNDYLKPPNAPSGFFTQYISPLSEVPDVVVPSMLYFAVVDQDTC